MRRSGGVHSAVAYQGVASLSMVSVATQTDAGSLTELYFGLGREPARPRLCTTRTRGGGSSSDHQLSRLLQIEGADCSRSLGPSSYWGDCHGNREASICEEITLHRRNKEAKFGMTICYQTGSDVSSNGDDGDYEELGLGIRTEVYIGEIDPGGVAARDGRARIGDRILEINGERVESRDQVQQLLRADLPFIRLLLSRPSPTQRDDGFNDELDALECLSFDDEADHCALHLECIDEEDDATDDTTTTENDSQRQDSGVGKTDESTRNEESSEQEVIDDCILSPLTDVDGSCYRGAHRKINDSFQSADGHESDPDALGDELPSIFQCQQFYEMLKDRCNADLIASARAAQARAGLPSVFASKAASRKSHLQPKTSYDDYVVLERPRFFDEDVSLLGRQMAALDLERHQQLNHTRVGLARKVPRMGTKIEFNRATGFAGSLWPTQSPAEQSMSCRGEQDAVEGRRNFDNFQNFVDFPSRSGLGDIALEPGIVVYDIDGPRPNCATRLVKDLKGTSVNYGDSPNRTRTSQMCQTDDEGEYESLVPFDRRFIRHSGVTQYPAQSPRQEHASQVPIHQMPVSFRRNGKPDGKPGMVEAPAVDGKATQGAIEELEWVVKRRSDGSRYITRRPVRNRLLKERARRVEEERACQTTTDDDSSSALKTGRYWTKEDRRRHAEKTRNRRREKEASVRQRGVVVEGGVGGGGGGAGGASVHDQPDIVQLSRKKMAKCKSRRALDDFTTLQEFLAHGNRDPQNGRAFGQLLSVTTV